MNDRTFDALTRDYFDEGPSTLPDRVLEAALREAHGQRQRRIGIGAWVVWGRLGHAVRLAGIAIVIVAVVGVGAGTGGPEPRAVVSERVSGVWPASSEVVLTWRPITPGQHEPYLAAVTYATFEGDGWSTGLPARSVERAPDTDLLAGTADWIDPATRQTRAVLFTPARSTELVLSPSTPFKVDTTVEVELLGDAGWYTRLTRDPSNEPYIVTAMEPDTGPVGAVEEADRSAGRATYPAGLLERYGRSAVPPGSITTVEARALLDELEALGGSDPYDLATAAVRLFQDPTRFTYDTDVRDLPCTGLSVVDCFATHRRGYCEYFASTMAILLRELGVPTRYVQGFLPGTRDAVTGTWTVRDSDAHSWVQVYVPGSGWIDFDPTGGGRATIAPSP